MRIITGKARGKKLITLEGEAVRPTTDKVKESLFNILQFQLEGRKFLDMFAGCGQIALEAVSRGAESALLIDASKSAANVISQNIKACGFERECTLVNADSVMYVKNSKLKLDIAFIDPPYKTGIIESALLAAADKMNPGGIIICEHPFDEVLPETAGEFVKAKDYKYGKIVLTSYKMPGT